MGAGASVGNDAKTRPQTEVGVTQQNEVGMMANDSSSSKLVSRAIEKEMTKPVDGSDIAPGKCKGEVARLRRLLADPVAELSTGKVQINYQMYDEKFDIIDGRMAVEYLDDEYALSFAMPGCKLELITCEPQKKLMLENNPKTADQVPFVAKNEDGTHFIGMHTLDQYWVVVYEDEEQRKKDMEKVRARILADGVAKNEGEREVGCSCIEGNPCTEGNKYNCKNWELRFKIAAENGWKGH